VDKLGKNPLVIIDGKEYSPEILYNISKKGIRGSGVFQSEGATKKYGEKAKDGAVEISTKSGEISYMDDKERSALIKEKSASASQFYTRIQLDDKSDKIIFKNSSGGMSAGLDHNAKAAFFIDGKIYDEKQVSQLSEAKISEILSGAYGVGGAESYSIPGIELSDYVLLFWFKNEPAYTAAFLEQMEKKRSQKSQIRELKKVDGNTAILTSQKESDFAVINPSKDFNIRWSHSQAPEANLGSTFSASVNVGTSSYFRHTAEGRYGAAETNGEILPASAKVAQDPPGIIVPDSFTPNGDGKDDVFNITVTNSSIKIDTLMIYDRQMKLLYGTSDISKSWNGYRNNAMNDPKLTFTENNGRTIVVVNALGMVLTGSAANPVNYFWILEGRDNSNNKFSKRGFVTVKY
jgi:gliding motility-associated-like protein